MNKRSDKLNFTYNQIGNGLGFGNILDNILKNRGIDSPKDFLNVGEHNLEDYNLYDNITTAVICLMNHIEHKSKILVIVDSDLDGFTSAALMYQYIEKIQPNVDLYFEVHQGKKHGLDEAIMSHITNNNYNLIIIPDASSNDYVQHKHLKDLKIDIIILDHHLASEGYSADAIVVNNQLSSKIQNKTLTGVGVVYKFCKAIDKYLSVDYADDYLDLVSVGMIADSCDLKNLESRFLVLQGIEQIQNQVNTNKFISILIKKQSYSMGGIVTITGIAFYIAPLINSAIRSGTYEENRDIFKAFIGKHEQKTTKIRGKGEVELDIEEYALRICEKCKREQNKIVDSCVDILTQQIDKFKLNKYAIIVCNGTDIINENYTGLIANKIASKYQKPCLLLKTYNEDFSGSGRGFEKKNIKNFNHWCRNIGLFKYVEGHENAFGCGIWKDNINALYETIHKIECTDILNYEVDGIFNEKTLNRTIIEMIAKYHHIWGNKVQEPIFAIEDIIVNSNDVEIIGANKNTIKFSYQGINFIKFKTSEETYLQIKQNNQNKFTIIGKFSVNDYNGKTTAQIIIENMHFEKSNIIKQFTF